MKIYLLAIFWYCMDSEAKRQLQTGRSYDVKMFLLTLKTLKTAIRRSRILTPSWRRTSSNVTRMTRKLTGKFTQDWPKTHPRNQRMLPLPPPRIWVDFEAAQDPQNVATEKSYGNRWNKNEVWKRGIPQMVKFYNGEVIINHQIWNLEVAYFQTKPVVCNLVIFVRDICSGTFDGCSIGDFSHLSNKTWHVLVAMPWTYRRHPSTIFQSLKESRKRGDYSRKSSCTPKYAYVRDLCSGKSQRLKPYLGHFQ